MKNKILVPYENISACHDFIDFMRKQGYWYGEFEMLQIVKAIIAERPVYYIKPPLARFLIIDALDLCHRNKKGFANRYYTGEFPIEADPNGIFGCIFKALLGQSTEGKNYNDLESLITQFVGRKCFAKMAYWNHTDFKHIYRIFPYIPYFEKRCEQKTEFQLNPNQPQITNCSQAENVDVLKGENFTKEIIENYCAYHGLDRKTEHNSL